MTRLFWTIWVGPKCNCSCLHKRKQEMEVRGWSDRRKGSWQRDTVGLQKLEKARNQILPQSFWKEHMCQYLGFTLVNLNFRPLASVKRKQLCCFKPLNLWYFFTAPTRGNYPRSFIGQCSSYYLHALLTWQKSTFVVNFHLILVAYLCFSLSIFI